MQGPVLVLGLGNAILRDDGVGLRAAQGVKARLAPGEEIEVREAEVAGFALLDLLAEHRAAVILDALVSEDAPPGTVLEFGLEAFRPTTRLATAHQVDLPTAVALGRELGRDMPRRIRVLAVVAQDARTFGESLTPPVAAALDTVVERALALARELAQR